MGSSAFAEEQEILEEPLDGLLEEFADMREPDVSHYVEAPLISLENLLEDPTIEAEFSEMSDEEKEKFISDLEAFNKVFQEALQSILGQEPTKDSGSPDSNETPS